MISHGFDLRGIHKVRILICEMTTNWESNTERTIHFISKVKNFDRKKYNSSMEEPVISLVMGVPGSRRAYLLYQIS